MTPEELRKIGLALYGTDWQVHLAAALRVSTRSIRYWLSGKHKINKRTEGAIAALYAKLSEQASKKHEMAGQFATGAEV
jgi:hypothetical protein